jgi:hypothetical protein
MNKKFFLYGMIALLGASLFFLGCPTDSDDDDKTSEKSAAEKAGEALGEGVSVDGDNVTLTADKTLSAAFTIDADVTLTVSAGKTLTVPTGLTLTVNGTLTGVNTSKIVVEGSGTVTGSGLNFFNAVGGVLTSVTAGVYDWDAAFGEKVGGVAPGGWKQTEVAGYSLKETEGGADKDKPTESGIYIDSVTKDADGKVTITLKGTFDGKYITKIDSTTPTNGARWTEWEAEAGGDGLWGNGTGGSDDTYGPVNISGFFTQDLQKVAINIKPYPALTIYTTAAFGSGALTAPVAWDVVGGTNVYIPVGQDSEANRQKWKLYERFDDGENFGILLNKGSTSRIVKLDIDQYTGTTGSYTAAVSDKDILEVEIHYTDVSFPDEVIEPIEEP